MSALGVEQGATYVLTGPLGDRAVINDPTDLDFVGYLTEPPSGLERASIRESADDVAEGDGGIHDAFFYSRLAFTMTGLVFPDAGPSSSRQDKLMAATDCMDADGLLTWVPSTIPGGVQVAFRQQQPTRITDRRPKTFLVAGVSEDPVVYSQALHSAVIVPAALVVGGFASPLTSPIVSAPAVGGVATVTNDGRSKTYPIITISGPCQDPYITNTRTGKTLYFKYTLGAGESLVVNTNPKARSVLFNGQSNRYSALDSGRSSWWPLLKGDNILQIGYTAYSAGAQFQLDYRDAWG